MSTSQRNSVAVAFNRTSSNAKTGPIPVTTTGQQSCPEVCPLKGSGCYAETGPISWHWKKVTNGIKGVSYDAMLDEVSRLPKGQLWRHNAAGDLIHNNETIDGAALIDLVRANKKSKAKGFTYTHHDMTGASNREYVQYANDNGFTVNLSANSIEHADELKALNIGPVVTIMPIDCDKVTQTPAGNTIVQCPATYSDITCAQCGICQVATRKAIIGFPVHGARKASAHKVFMMQKG
ncbi:hypothetical protein P26059A_0114 [Curvibacter phage P26059A]|nr:hypothetical protein P26059A_0114 [Curvibacter phage P26059A]